VKVFYRQTASDDVVRQFRYYLVDENLPEVAVRFSDAIRHTVELLCQHPLVGARNHLSTRNFTIYAHGRLQDLRPFGFIILRIVMLSTLFAFCTESVI
jgi:plasmid stabilization system protein ParE